MGCGEDRLGFIVFECGLEGVKLKVVKRSQFEKGENGDGDKKTETEIFCTDSVKSQEDLDNNTPGKDLRYIKYINQLLYSHIVWRRFYF